MYVSKTIQSRMIHTTHMRYVVYMCTFVRASPPIKLINGTDRYVGYCIPHNDQYHTMRTKTSTVVAFSVKALVIKIIRRKRSNQIPCTFSCTCY